MTINVVDLFAGPGGLGEGFSACLANQQEPAFRIVASVEKEASAHATLTLRAFFRKIRNIPEALVDYERFRRKEISRQELFRKWPAQHAEAMHEVLGRPVELGKDNHIVSERLESLKRASRGRRDDAWVVIGGPPCQAYSLVGRARNRGNACYRPEEDERNFLYREYLKVLASLQPEAFVMENVRGILSARVGEEYIFPRILEDIASPGRATGLKDQPTYDIFSLVVPGEITSFSDYLIKAEQYGIPQRRHRVILLGVRRDLDRKPRILQPKKRQTSVEDILFGLPTLRSRLSRGGDSPRRWYEEIEVLIRKTAEILRPENPSLSHRLLKNLQELSLDLPVEVTTVNYIENSFGPYCPEELKSWIAGKSRSLTGHQARGHMASDLARYFYAATFAEEYGRSPKAPDFPECLEPNHLNWRSGKFNDRFRVQLWQEPATTVTSHISKDGHYFIHPDPLQCRSLTVREAARLQTFPDDYHFEGNRTQQYVQVGNAVPPYLARQIAALVLALLH